MRRRTMSGTQAATVDLLLAVACAVLGAWRELAFPAQGVRLFDLPVGWYVAAQIAGGLLLLARRRLPGTTTGAQAALNLVSPTVASIVVAYSVAVHRRHIAAAVGSFGLVLGCWLLGATYARLEDRVSGPLVLTIAFLIGLYVYEHRRLLDEIADRAERAEREQVLLAERAVASERASIARDMHDAIAHRISLMVLQAGALTVSAPSPEFRQSAEELRASGAQALEELRTLVGVLRTTPSSGVGNRRTASEIVNPLVDGARRAGMTISLDALGASRTLDEPAGLVVERLVQESLTNAAEHAAGAPVRIRVVQDDEGTTVTVCNPLRGAGSSARSLVRGSGLLGLAERVERTGGSFHAAPRQDDEFVVEAVLPHQSGPPAEVRR